MTCEVLGGYSAPIEIKRKRGRATFQIKDDVPEDGGLLLVVADVVVLNRVASGLMVQGRTRVANSQGRGPTITLPIGTFLFFRLWSARERITRKRLMVPAFRQPPCCRTLVNSSVPFS